MPGAWALNRPLYKGTTWLRLQLIIVFFIFGPIRLIYDQGLHSSPSFSEWLQIIVIFERY
jgi:hypothetical protein